MIRLSFEILKLESLLHIDSVIFFFFFFNYQVPGPGALQ